MRLNNESVDPVNIPPALISGSQPPVMKTWPDPTTPGIAETDDAIRRTYAIFPDDAGRLGFYRLAGTPAVWERIRTFNEGMLQGFA